MNIFLWRIFPIQVLILLTFIPAFWFLSSAALSADIAQKRVLIINSNQSNKIYGTIHRAFKSGLNVNQIEEIQIEEIDLARTYSTSTVKRQISRVRPQIVYTIGSEAYRQASKIIKNNPLIFSGKNLHRFNLSYNTYGIPLEPPAEMPLFMYHYLFPEIRTIGVLYSENYRQWFNHAKSKAYEVGVTLHGQATSSSSEISYALRQLLTRVDAIWLNSDDPVMSDISNLRKILNETAARQKPIFANQTLFIKYGAVLTIAADIPAIGRQAASLARQILLNPRTITEKVQFPTSSKVTVNLKKVREYGITINKAALSSVDKIIQ